jgi:EmrB/QacA subfamily drug resistance transporter
MNKRIVLLIATIASFVTPFMASAVTIALPTIGKELSMSALALGWVATSYIFAAAVFLLPFGKAADIHGRKKIFLVGMSIFTVASACCGLAPSATALIALRVVQGIGASMTFSAGVAIVTSVVPGPERGRALGLTTAATYVGLSVGPLAGGMLTQHFGWRSVFLVTVPLGVAVIALVVTKLRGEWADARGERFDFPGAFIVVPALAAIMYGFSRLPSGEGIWLLLGGALGIVAFVRWELRAKHPLLHMELFAGNRIFVFSNLAALINYSASFAVTFLMSLYLQYIKALTPQGAGLVLVAQPIVMAAFSPLAGRLSDRIESRIVASAGMAVTAAALVFLVSLGEGTRTATVIVNLMLLGLGFALFSSPNTNAVMSCVEPRRYGVASATLATARMIGQMLSMGIAMLVFAVQMGDVHITPERHEAFLASLRIAFIIFAALSAAGIFASLARGNARTCADR